METKKNVKFAGDIRKELETINSLTELSLESEAQYTQTKECGMFLTIYCC